MELNWTRLESGVYVCGGNMSGWKVVKKVWTKPGIIKGGRQAEGWVVVDPSGTERTSAFPRLLDGKAYVQDESDKATEYDIIPEELAETIQRSIDDPAVHTTRSRPMKREDAPLNHVRAYMPATARIQKYARFNDIAGVICGLAPKLTAKQMRRVRKKANKHGELIPQIVRG